MRTSMAGLVLVLALFPSPLHSEVRFKAYYEGLPDLDKDPPFAHQTPQQATVLHKLVTQERAVASPCPETSKPIPGAQELCGRLVGDAQELLGTASRRLAPQQISRMWLAELNRDREPELLVQYDTEVGEASDRYAAFFAFRWTGETYSVTAASWFLEGSLHAIHPFGPAGGQTVFIRVQSCTECHPWVYLVAYDFLAKRAGAAFEFSYNPEATDAWRAKIEYHLPGMGHSIDAAVETRLPDRPGSRGPHLLQYFDVEDGEDEWWAFVCSGQRCSPQLFKGKAPQSLLEVWNKAKLL